MRLISKYFIIGTLMLFLTAFMPLEHTQAQIFEGTDEAGLCIGEPDLEKYPKCKGIDCSDEEYVNNLLCVTEVQAGTNLAETSLEGAGITGTDNFADFIKKLVNFFLPYLTLAAFVGYVVAGFLYVTAFGNDDQLTKAKTILIWSSIGLILVILSFAITQLFTSELVNGLNENSENAPDLNQLKNS